MRRLRGAQPRTGKPAKNRLVVLLDDDELARLHEMAGDDTVSDFVRRRLFGRRGVGAQSGAQNMKPRQRKPAK